MNEAEEKGLALFTEIYGPEMAEGTRLGIPLVFKDNARNHVETDPRQGIGAGSGAFSQFPKEAGLAAAALGEQFLKEGKATTGDMSVIKTFTEVMLMQPRPSADTSRPLPNVRIFMMSLRTEFD